MFLAELFLVMSLHLASEALQCNRYRARTIMNVAMNNKCYYAWPRRRGTYNEAVKLCQKGGTHVLFTETKEEHHRLISRLGPAFTRIWIGLERNGSEWRWQGGQRSRPVEKLLFADNHKSTKGHNAIVSKSKGQYIWQVQDPNKTFQMVCEQEQGKNTADRVFEESSPDGRYETTGGLANSESADSAISTETEFSWAATDTSSLFVVGQGTLRVQGSITETVVMATGESLESEETKSTVTVSGTQMPYEISYSRFEVKKDLNRIPVPSWVNVETSASFNEDFRVVTDATQNVEWDAGSRLGPIKAHGQSSNLIVEPEYSIIPGQFSPARRSIKSEQTTKMDQTFTREQSGNLGDSSFLGQGINPGQTIKPGKTFAPKQTSSLVYSSFPEHVINPGQTVKREQTFTTKQSSRGGDSNLQETYITSEQTFDQVSDFTFEAQSSNLQQATVRQQNNTVRQDPLEKATQETTSILDQGTESSLEIVSVGFSATTVPTPASTTLRTGQDTGTEPLPSVDALISSTIPSQIHSVRRTVGDRTSPLAVTESHQLSSSIHSPINARENNIDLSFRSTFEYKSTAFVGPSLITAISSNNRLTSAISSIGSVENSQKSALMESSIPELASDMRSGSVLPLSLELSGIIGYSASGTIASANLVILPTAFGKIGPSAPGDTESSASGGVISSAVPVVIKPTAAGAIGSFFPPVFRSSNLDRILPSTSDVIVASASDLTGSSTSGMIESSAFGGIDSSVSSLIRSSASGVNESSTSGPIKQSTSNVTELSSSGSSTSGVIASSASDDVSGSLAPVVVWPAGTGAIGSFGPSVLTSSTLDRTWSSTVISDVSVASASDLTGLFASGTIESSAFDEIEPSASSLIRSAASGVIWSPTSGVIAPTAFDNVEPSASGAITSPSSGGVSGSLAPPVMWPAGRAVGLFGSGVSRSSSLDMIWSTHFDVIRSFTSGAIESTAFSLVELTASVAIVLSASGVMEPSASNLNELSTPHAIESSVIGPTAYDGMGTPSSGGVIGSLAPVALWPTGDGAIFSFAPSVVTSSTLDTSTSSTSNMIVTTVSDLTEPFVSGITESSTYDVMEWSASRTIKPSASGFYRLSFSDLSESPFSGLSALSASDMLELPLSGALVSDVHVIGSYASSAVRASTLRTTGSFASDVIGSDASGPVSSRLVSSATLEQSANIIRIRSSFSSLSHATAVLARKKSDSTSPSVVLIPFSSSDSSSKLASLSLDTPISSGQESLAVATTDPVQGTISTPISRRVLTSVTTTESFDDWTDISASLDSIPTISLTMPATTSVAVATSSPRDMGHVQNKVPKILEAGYYVVANSSDHKNNIETFAFRKVTTITDVTMTTTFPATTTINCARLCASGQYECNIVVFKDRICRLYSL